MTLGSDELLVLVHTCKCSCMDLLDLGHASGLEHSSGSGEANVGFLHCLVELFLCFFDLLEGGSLGILLKGGNVSRDTTW